MIGADPNGNGRMSRLLTTLLFYRSGFYVGKYISLEAKQVSAGTILFAYKDLFTDSALPS